MVEKSQRPLAFWCARISAVHVRPCSRPQQTSGISRSPAPDQCKQESHGANGLPLPFIETVFFNNNKKESLYFYYSSQLVFDGFLGPQTILTNEPDQRFRIERNPCRFNKTSPGDLWPPTSAIWLSHWLHHINPTEHERGSYEQNEWPGIKSWWVKRFSSLYVIAHFAKLRSLRSIFCWY